MKVEIKSDGPRRQSVSIDGEEVRNVRALTVRMEAGAPPVVTLELVNPELLGQVTVEQVNRVDVTPQPQVQP